MEGWSIISGGGGVSGSVGPGADGENPLVGKWVCWNDGYLRRSCASAQRSEDGRWLSPTLSCSLGTSSPQLEPPKALPSMGRARVGNRARIGMESIWWCLDGENSGRTRPRGGSGSSCAGHHGSMTGGNVRALGSSAQSGRLSADGSRTASSPLPP